MFQTFEARHQGINNLCLTIQNAALIIENDVSVRTPFALDEK